MRQVIYYNTAPEFSTRHMRGRRMHPSRVRVVCITQQALSYLENLSLLIQSCRTNQIDSDAVTRRTALPYPLVQHMRSTAFQTGFRRSIKLTDTYLLKAAVTISEIVFVF